MFEGRVKDARTKVKQLLNARVIQEIDYLEWSKNPIMVDKLSGKWRMCVNFPDLSKSCPKDESHFHT